MNNKITRFPLYLIFFSVATLLIHGCEKKEQQQERNLPPQQSIHLSDKLIEDFQIQLLAQAFKTASVIPIETHLSDRSRAQLKIVEACLELNQPVRAKSYCDGIDVSSWRHGQAYGKLADYCIKHDDLEGASYCLTQIEKVLKGVEEKLAPEEIDWKRDHLTAIIEKISARLKRADIKSKQSPQANEAFDERIKILEGLAGTGEFETIHNALYGFVELFTQNYNTINQRSLTEDKIKSFWTKMAPTIKLELLWAMTEAALDHADQETALRLVNEAQLICDEYDWRVRHLIPLKARVVKLRYLSGDTKKAGEDADSLLKLYNDNASTIFNYERSDVLLPLAEAYHAMNGAQAASIYQMAIEEGAVNPNSRPRAIDLSTACVSMALNAFEPNKKQWNRIFQIHEGLNGPW